MTDIGWEEAKCPVCHEKYRYTKGGYKPKTCSKFECIHKFLHPDIYDLRTRKELDNLKSMRR